MWIIYEKGTGKMIKSFHLKKKAKMYLQTNYWAGTDRDHWRLQKVDPDKLAAWQSWLILSKTR